MYETLLQNSLTPALITESNIDAEFYPVIIGDILKDKIKSFIGYYIADVQILKQPAGLVFARKESADSFEIIKKMVNITTNKTIVNISIEAWDDMLNLIRATKLNDDTPQNKIPDLFNNWVKSCSAFKETQEILQLIKDNAIAASPLVLTDANDSKDNAEANLFYISKKVNDLIIQMNAKTFRTYDAFCILPQQNIGGILALSFTYSRVDDSSDENRAYDYFLGKINNTRYFLNPDPNETNVLVGLKSNKEKGVNSLIYSPYNINLSTATNANTGDLTIAVFTRNGFTIHPLHSTDNPMLYKFELSVN